MASFDCHGWMEGDQNFIKNDLCQNNYCFFLAAHADISLDFTSQCTSDFPSLSLFLSHFVLPQEAFSEKEDFEMAQAVAASEQSAGGGGGSKSLPGGCT